MAAEALFYHLTLRQLDDVAPDLLDRCLQRGLRVVFRLGGPERVAALSARLWAWRDEAFLPHGGPEDPFPDRQPIYLTAGPETPNSPCTLFLADGAEAEDADFARFARVVSLFDGGDEAAVLDGRARWKRAVAAGCKCVYYAQGAGGAWEKRAERDPAAP